MGNINLHVGSKLHYPNFGIFSLFGSFRILLFKFWIKKILRPIYLSERGAGTQSRVRWDEGLNFPLIFS
jgi:hypothetical protein